MDRMANFNISAEEEEMLLGVEDMDDHTNSRPMDLTSTRRMIHGITHYQVTFVIESEYHKILVHC